jgi:hypothetical protein
MRHQLGRNPAGPFIAKPVVTIGEIPDILCPNFPLKRLEPVKIICIYQSLLPKQRFMPAVLLHHFQDCKIFQKIAIYAFCHLWHFR